MKNFALIGAAGYIAPRHMEAIQKNKCRLVAAMDPSDSVGVLDKYFPDAAFFTEIERFDRHLEKLRLAKSDDKVDYVSICSPNYLHDAHIRLALRVGAHAICEKPLALTPWNLDALSALEQHTGKKIFNVLQLRVHDDIVKLKRQYEESPLKNKIDVELSYITRRGRWYEYSWKGNEEKSGGIAANIGVHFFDMLMWLFGGVESCEMHIKGPTKMGGYIELERARVKWFLSVDGNDLPKGYLEQGKSAYRSITLAGKELEFSGGFTDLHNRVYQSILEGHGYGVQDAKPSIEFVHSLRTVQVTNDLKNAHPTTKKFRA
jgi:UDP-N-acetyl-2-amino-2-deoxyglucuronate dehydrogenase